MVDVRTRLMPNTRVVNKTKAYLFRKIKDEIAVPHSNGIDHLRRPSDAMELRDLSTKASSISGLAIARRVIIWYCASCSRSRHFNKMQKSSLGNCSLM
jgi:hypothetical protein